MKHLLILSCLLLVGCLQQASGPDYVPPQPNPQPAPYEPVGNVRSTISASLQGANREDCLTVYGIYSAAARYVQGDSLQASNTHELRTQIKQVCELRGWVSGRYPEFGRAFIEVTDPVLKQNKTLLDRRSEVSNLFEQIALGAKDAAR